MSNELWKQAAQRTADCPAPEQWAEYLSSPSPAPALDRHRSTCAACQAEIALLTAFETSQPQPHETADLRYVLGKLKLDRAQESPAREPWWHSLFSPATFRAWALAAVVLIVAGVAWEWRSGQLQPVRQDVQDQLRSTSTVEVVSVGGDLEKAPTHWVWKSVKGARSYQVQILAVDGEQLWQSPLTDQASYGALPLGLFVERKTVALKVTAFDAAGKPLATSPEVKVRVLPSSGSR